MISLRMLLPHRFPAIRHLCFPSLVFSNRENYIHRIGRSGRFGRKGVAINVRISDLFNIGMLIPIHFPL
jgi:hypothetical protein